MIKKRLIQLMGDSKKYIACNVLWQWLSLAASVAAVISMAWIFELTVRSEADAGRMAAAALIAALSIGFKAVCQKRAALASYRAGSDVKRVLRETLYAKLSKMGASYYEKVPTAEAVQVAVEGIEQLEVYYGKYLPQLFYSLLAPLTLFSVLSFISVKAGLVLLVCVPLIPVTIMAVQKLAKRLLNKYWGIYTGLGDSFLENLQGLTTLKIYQADERKAREMDEEAERFRKITMKVLTMQLNSIIVMDLVAYGGAAMGMIVTVLEYQAGRVGIMGAFTIILLSAEFFIPMRLLGSFFHVAMNGMAASDKLFAILDIEEKRGGNREINEISMPISLNHVSFSYEKERPILKGVSMEITPRGLTALAGRSGCGKSTIASLLTGRQTGYQGNIRLGDLELKDISEESLMSHVTLVSHNSYLFKGTVEDNLRMAAPEASGEQLMEVLKKVNLYEYLMSQDGLNTRLMERGSNLSGGQCQRLALARALLHDTPFYILDEATSNIDVESENQIMKVVHDLAKTKGVLLISHRLANVVNADVVYVLSEGRLAERGTHESLMAKGKIYAQMYQKQLELERYTVADAQNMDQRGEKEYA